MSPLSSLEVRRALVRSLFAAAVLAAVVAAIPTAMDWRLNPAGIFRDAAGTDWAVVSETFLSWFLPTFPVLVVPTVVAVVVKERRRDSTARAAGSATSVESQAGPAESEPQREPRN